MCSSGITNDLTRCTKDLGGGTVLTPLPVLGGMKLLRSDRALKELGFAEMAATVNQGGSFVLIYILLWSSARWAILP